MSLLRLDLESSLYVMIDEEGKLHWRGNVFKNLEGPQSSALRGPLLDAVETSRGNQWYVLLASAFKFMYSFIYRYAIL